MEIANPYGSMVSFQEELAAGRLSVGLVPPYTDVYSHLDRPTPTVTRLTYVRLAEDRKTVKAFVACIMNGYVDGCPCTSVGYAVPENMRNQGHAKQLFKEVIKDQVVQAGKAGFSTIFVEAVADVDNIASQRVAEAVLNAERESIIDSASGKPAYRYTRRFSSEA